MSADQRAWNRRRLLLAGVGTSAAMAGIVAWTQWPDEGLWNPCLSLPDTPDPVVGDMVRAAWAGLDGSKVWDVHVHLFGLGDSGGRIWVNPVMRSWAHPFEFVHTQFYANAACATGHGATSDEAYVARLIALHPSFPHGSRLLLLAMDYFHDEAGERVPAKTVFHVPDDFAAQVAAQYPDHFEWIASIHPYRADCVDALEWAVAHRARAVKWIPSTMGIDPASPRCDRFYRALARLDVPLLTHGGYEHPLIDSGGIEVFNNPLALRRSLDTGVRVVVAHCASTGAGVDIDQGSGGPVVENFALFTRLMDEQQYQGRLFGDISAVTESSRVGPLLYGIVRNQNWHGRLLNGSDYPLPGYLPAISVRRLLENAFITAPQASALIAIRKYNPLLFDFVLKRHLTADGVRFPASVFETAGFFSRPS